MFPLLLVARPSASDSTTRSASRTLGIDLSSQPAHTAACVVEWGPPRARVVEFRARADDELLLELMTDPAVTKVGIDAPFGWPAEFVAAVQSYSETGVWPETDQRQLVLRETDRQVWQQTGRPPLSVSTDKIAYTAMRCARLLTDLGRAGVRVDRSGRGLVVEVYPAAALLRWGYSPRGYKGPKPQASARRRELLASIVAATRGRLALTASDAAHCEASDHHLDALISTLVARSVETGQAVTLAPEHLDCARQEGWIHLPDRSLLELLSVETAALVSPRDTGVAKSSRTEPWAPP